MSTYEMEYFTSWPQYFAQLGLSLNTEFYFEEYPQYGELMDDLGILDEQIIKMLLEERKLDAQEGYDGFIDCLIHGSRYAMELEDQIERIIDMFVARGAKIDFDVFFKSYVDDFDEFNVTPVCGHLIDCTAKHGLDATKYGPWETIEETYWEYADQSLPARDIERMYLKWSSKVLGGTRTY